MNIIALVGPINIDFFQNGNDYVILEINQRFGEGYLHAYERGVNVPAMIVNNIFGNENVNQIFQYDEIFRFVGWFNY